MGDTNAIIKLKGIKKKYVVSDEIEVVLDSLNYAFSKGYNTTIIGSSGCGKTTLLNIIGGVETDFEGELLFYNEPIKDFDKFRREHVSYIFQDLNLVHHLNLIDNIKIGLTNNVDGKTKKALALLEQVGLKDHADKLPNQLSGGEKQRVAIARALARDTDILLCDEPTGNLDKKMKYEIMDLITEVFKDKTVIYVTHDLEIAEKYSDIILTIENNVLVEKKRKEVAVSVSDKAVVNDELDKTFEKRYIKNLLHSKFSIVNASYLIVFISAIFMFAVGAILGVEKEIDNYVNDLYKTDMLFMGNPGMSYEGITVNQADFNRKFVEDIEGFMVGTIFTITYTDTELENRYFINVMQESVKSSFESDLVAGSYPESNDEIIYSVGSARKMIFEYYHQDITDDEEATNQLFEWVESLNDEVLLIELQKLDLSYFNAYRYNSERYYDNDIEVVGIIDDYYYLSRDYVATELEVDRFNTYGFNTNQYITITYQGEEKNMVVNTNVYFLEEEFLTYMSRVYIGLNTHQFNYMMLMIEDEDLDIRESVFDDFLLFKPLFTGRNRINDERDEYFDDMLGYKVSILGGCFLLGALALVSLFNGIKSNVDKYRRDIGIYKTLGYTSSNIRRMFVIEGMIIAGTILVSVIVMWGALNLVLNESIVDALDPNRLAQSETVIYFDIYSAIIIVSLIIFVILSSIGKQLQEVNIINLIRNK